MCSRCCLLWINGWIQPIVGLYDETCIGGKRLMKHCAGCCIHPPTLANTTSGPCWQTVHILALTALTTKHAIIPYTRSCKRTKNSCNTIITLYQARNTKQHKIMFETFAQRLCLGRSLKLFAKLLAYYFLRIDIIPHSLALPIYEWGIC